jgi:hypothetical protein
MVKMIVPEPAMHKEALVVLVGPEVPFTVERGDVILIKKEASIIQLDKEQTFVSSTDVLGVM